MEDKMENLSVELYQKEDRKIPIIISKKGIRIPLSLTGCFKDLIDRNHWKEYQNWDLDFFLSYASVLIVDEDQKIKVNEIIKNNFIKVEKTRLELELLTVIDGLLYENKELKKELKNQDLIAKREIEYAKGISVSYKNFQKFKEDHPKTEIIIDPKNTIFQVDSFKHITENLIELWERYGIEKIYSRETKRFVGFPYSTEPSRFIPTKKEIHIYNAWDDCYRESTHRVCDADSESLTPIVIEICGYLTT